MTQEHRLPAGPIKNVRVPMSDVEAAKSVEPPRFARTENAKRFAAMGAAILEKMCRSGSLAVHARKTLPYILDTARGKTAISVMVSTISGDPMTKHMIVPLGGLNVKLAGWATAEEVLRYSRANTSVATRVEVAPVPVCDLHPIHTLRHYLSPAKNNAKKETKCENHA